MANVLPDDLDYSAYERDTEARVKVRKASDFTEELIDHINPKAGAKRSPDMFSTKLRGDMQFRPGEVTCWSGYSKHKKSIFTGQLALDLCVQKQRVLMASFEMYPADTLGRMARQALAGEHPSNASLERFSKWTDSRLWLLNHVGRFNPSQLIAVLRYFSEELKGTHAFIDSMMMVVGSEEKMDEQKQFATDLIRLAQETGLHIHLITHCRKPAGGDESKPPTKYDVRGTSSITDQAHNIITVWANKAKKSKLDQDPNDIEALAQPDALVTVEGQRASGWEGRVKLWFDSASMRFMDERHTPVEPYVLEAA